MMRFLKAITRHIGKRGQRGQALVILAVGFIGLLGFVGIVTDVSLLFIRYSTMRRAVDAASVAAAGQMRRIADLTPPGTPLDDGIAQDEADSVAQLNLAARQFIELYGLDPKMVLVETCRAQQVKRDASQNPLDRNDILLFQSDGTPNPAANQDDVKRYQELCTKDELKLVRVTAQIDAPTIFMRLLGYNTITLTESAISQTAVIDVVLIMDVSESMLNETTYSDWDTLTPKQGVRYMPPYVDPADHGDAGATPPRNDPWNEMLYDTQTTLNTVNTNPALQYVINDTIDAFEPDGAGGWQAYTGAGSSPVGREEPREECRVRSYPASVFGVGPGTVPLWLKQEYLDYYGANYSAQFGYPVSDPDNVNDTQWYTGWVPEYNYFGCCNDPNGDGTFEDLICQPFRSARDAAQGFLARLDFLRGDRVALVTFDRYATAIDPDGNGPQSAMIETEYDLKDGTGTLLRHGANETLNNLVGVRAEESTYVDLPAGNPDGDWDAIYDGGIARTYADFMNVPVGDIIDNPVAFACPYDKAISGPQFSTARTMPDASPRGNRLIDDVHTVPSWYAGSTDIAYVSYEYRGSCRGTNIGGALAAGSATLYNTGRREGSVWIMVLMTDGAAGASNPVTRDGNPPSAPNVYNLTPSGNNDPLNALGTSGALRTYPLPAQTYGAFGLCPYGTSGSPGHLLSGQQPYCQDQDPTTRHICGTVAQNPGAMALDMFPNCVEYYDVDDYARDWADWIGVADLPGAATGALAGRVTDQLLPTIFTIGFGLNFNQGTGITCGATDYDCIRGINTTPPNQYIVQDYLGEELLRYIADVGDNFQIDNDYWQAHLGSIIANTPPDWGPRGACEDPTPLDAANPGNTYQPLPPTEDCGNYFSAAGGAELEQVFNEIASRMFTRLSQ